MRKRLEAYKISTTEVENNIAEKQRELAKMKKATETLERALKAAEEAFGGGGNNTPSSSSMSVDQRFGGSVTKPRGKYRGRGKPRGSRGGRGRGGGGGYGPPGFGGGYGGGGLMWG